MASMIRKLATRIVAEPPFRIATQQFLKVGRRPVATRIRWNIAERTHYLAGVSYAATQAAREGIGEISIFEFGVAGGRGLLALQKHAREVETESGISIKVYGFDSGVGLPETPDDYRNHPDHWQAGDYPMESSLLRDRLTRGGGEAELVLGPIAETIPEFIAAHNYAPVGFNAFDLDLYSSTRDAFRIFDSHPDRLLCRVALYFDDTASHFNHRFAGELLAIDEFNASNNSVKIDQWRGLKHQQVFADMAWLEKLYVAHNLSKISRASKVRRPAELPLKR